MEEEKKYEREKIAVVTGGVRGIGLGISLALKKKGYRVYALYSKDEKSAAAAQGEGVIPVKADVRNEAEIVAFFSVLRHVDVLVNNAGIAVAAQLQDTSAEMLDELYAVNVRGAFLCARTFCRTVRRAIVCCELKVLRTGGVARASLNRAFSNMQWARNRVTYP